MFWSVWCVFFIYLEERVSFDMFYNLFCYCMMCLCARSIWSIKKAFNAGVCDVCFQLFIIIRTATARLYRLECVWLYFEAPMSLCIFMALWFILVSSLRVFVCAGTVGVRLPEVAQIRSKQNGNMQQGVGVGKLISAPLAITQELGSGFWSVSGTRLWLFHTYKVTWKTRPSLKIRPENLGIKTPSEF